MHILFPPSRLPFSLFFFFNDAATTEIYTLSLHDALPILCPKRSPCPASVIGSRAEASACSPVTPGPIRSEEHTSELQSHVNLVCRLLLEKKKKKQNRHSTSKSEEAYDYVPSNGDRGPMHM